MSAPVRPVLRYFGGKWRIAPWIIRHLPPHDVYIEPFCGAASVFFRKPRARLGSVLNDTNGEIVNLFRILRDPLLSEKLITLLKLTPFAQEELVNARTPDNGLDPVERARRLVVRSQFGRGSCLLRNNTGFRSRRRYNPYPARDWEGYPDSLRDVVKRLRGETIENLPALEVIERYDGDNVLFYVDPPYPWGERRKKNEYADGEMSNDDHRTLARTLRSVSGMVVLSGYRCALMDELYGDWQREEFKTRDDGGTERTECLWLSPNTGRKLRSMELPLFGRDIEGECPE